MAYILISKVMRAYKENTDVHIDTKGSLSFWPISKISVPRSKPYTLNPFKLEYCWFEKLKLSEEASNQSYFSLLFLNKNVIKTVETFKNTVKYKKLKLPISSLPIK